MRPLTVLASPLQCVLLTLLHEANRKEQSPAVYRQGDRLRRDLHAQAHKINNW